MHLEAFFRISSLIILVAHILFSNCRGVGPGLWPISSRVSELGTIYLAVMKLAPFSDSCADGMTAYIIFDIT